jgi:glycine cleavage system aminomethyltransferase T
MSTSAPSRTVVADFEEPGWDYGVFRSPYHELHRANGAKHCVYNLRLMPVSQGGDRITEYWALRRGVGLWDTGERPTEIKGPDAEALCNRIFTRECSTLKPGRAGYALLLYPDGGILCDGILLRLAQDRFWYVQAEGPVFPWLVAHAQGMNVTIRDPRSWITQVQGPRSLDVLAAACDQGAPQPFGYFGVAKVSMGGQKVLVTRTGWTGELGFEFYTLPDEGEVDGPALWRHVLKAGKPFGMAACGLDSMDIRRIEAGILNNVSDMDETMNPFQAGLGDFINLDKPDFVGKAALKTADRGLLLHGLRCRSAEPLIGGAVRAGRETIGRVTAAAWSPLYTAGVAIIRLKTASAAKRPDIHVQGRDLGYHAAEIVDLPMYDAEKRIPRGKELTVPAGPLSL